MKYRITLISDTHNKYKQIDLPVGDILINAGDSTSMGYDHEIKNFCEWIDNLSYDLKVFIAGNHDWAFQNSPNKIKVILNEFPNIKYLQDKLLVYDDIKIYGSPWQPEFMGWAFNLPTNGWELEQKWKDIPINTDILITHCPPFGILDKAYVNSLNLGCELLKNAVNIVKPKIHVFGHIHGGYGYIYRDGTHFFIASVLNEHYLYTNKPITFDWDIELNEIEFI